MSSLSSDPQALPPMEALQAPPSCRPRVVIVGAGMSGLSAAHRLTSLAAGHFDLTVIEASNRVGGRICSSTFKGERVEMGATWIHGIEGSPIHDIAQRMGLMRGDVPWECMDGFPEDPVVVAQGGLHVPPHLVDSIGDLYKKLYDVIQYTDGGLQQFSECDSGAPVEKFKQLKKELKGASVGAYLWEGFKMYSATEEKSLCNGTHSNGHGATGERKLSSSWNVKALREGVFRMRENVERSVTAAEMNDLDMECNDEYWEYPGEHMTIGHGYSSIIHFLASSLPEKTIQFNKEVTKIAWLNDAAPVHIECVDGTSYEADHVIITVSLGVLKAEAPPAHAKCVQLNRLFHPPLPPWKLHAISKLGFGVVDKCFVAMKPAVAGATYPHMQLVFREEDLQDACEDHGLTDIPWWMRKNFSFYPIHKSSHVVCTWLTGKEAMEMEGLADKEVIDGVVRTMESFGFEERIKPCAESKVSSRECDGVDLQGVFSGMHVGSPNVEGIVRSQWGSNPLYRGSYSYVAVGSTGEDIDTLAEPLPKASSEQGDAPFLSHSPLQLLFAGEATHRYCYSTTHGAFLSGVREAERLVKSWEPRGDVC